MRILPLILPVLLMVFVNATRQTDSPHGNDFRIPCNTCHNTRGWELDPEVYAYDHNTAGMSLVGQHAEINCRLCHTSLEFKEAETDCYSCHTDLHEQTVGNDCGRCHTPQSWIVSNVTDIHRQGRFPLLGAHLAAECAGCHSSASSLRFEAMGVECVDCHMADYQATTEPNHMDVNLGTECADCHSLTAFSWSGAGFVHQFFPLTLGHDIRDCSSCHSSGSFSDTSPDCYTCHQDDYQNTVNPAHEAAGISTDCQQCHTTRPDWKPAGFPIHDAQFFPIYSGEHRGEWDNCTQCHQDANNYSNFTCLTCHEHSQSRMDDKHSGENDYSYNSMACLECHPRGSED
ncbi:MAG: hypothetical protein P1P86_11790 [Bacteroidales bacterium]|nr:hypothetical protein [Bacteroidales bacterium]